MVEVKTQALLIEFVKRVASAPVDAGPPENMEEALVMFDAIRHQNQAARVLTALIHIEQSGGIAKAPLKERTT